MIARRLATTSGQYDGPRGATPADQANVMSLIAVGISSRLSMKMSSAISPEPFLHEHVRQLAHLAPHHADAPVLDVEVVVLDVVEHRAAESELGLEVGLVVAVEQVDVLRGDTIAFGDHRLLRCVDLLARLQLADVAAHERERDVESLGPHRIGVVEAGAVGVVEPRILRLGVLGQPDLAAGRATHRGQRLVDGALAQDVGDAALDRQAGQAAQLLVGAEQIDLDAGDHLGDRQVGDAGEDLLAEPEVIEVRGVPEVEHLEVELPQLEREVDQFVVAVLQVVHVAATGMPGDDFQRHHVGQWLVVQRLELGDHFLGLDDPLGLDRIPVGEVVAGALHEVLDTTGNVRRDWRPVRATGRSSR